MTKEEAADIVERLRAACTDWDGSALPPGSEPMDGLHCDVLIEAADQIEWLSTVAQANEEAHIETLKESIATITALRQQLAEARANALEAAAREAASSPVNFEGRDIAASIRALGASTLPHGTDPKPHTSKNT